LYAQESNVDHSASNYELSNTLPITQKFPVDIYCPEVSAILPWSIYSGVSFSMYHSSFSNYVSNDAIQYILGMTKNFTDFNNGYTTIYSLLEAKTYDSTSSAEGVSYKFTKTDVGAGLGIQQGLWTRKILLFLNVTPGFYQSSFRSDDNSINDYSYNIFLGLSSGFRFYFVKNNDYIFYSNLNISVDLARKNSLTLASESSVDPNQYALFPGIEFGFGF
jgi:hypothetical protein